MNATASKLNFKLKLERYFQRKYLTHLFPTLHTRRPNTQWAGYSKGLPCTLSLVTLSLLSSNLTMSASSCFYTDSCVSLQQLWRSSSTEWARSRVQPQDCKNKTTNTTAQQRTHKAFPKSQLMSSPSLVPPYFTLSLYIIPTLPLQLQSIIESQLEAQCSFILVFPLPGSFQHRGLQMTLYEYEWTVILF